MTPVCKFFLRSTPDKQTVERILKYIQDFGQGKASIDKQGGFAVLYVDDRRDVDLIKQRFGRMIDAEMNLT